MLTRQWEMTELAEGTGLVLSGREWTVAGLVPYLGRVQLRDLSGHTMDTTVAALLNHPDCRPSANTAALRAHSRGRQPASMADLLERHQNMLSARYAHLMETETGYRSGTRHRASASEPRPAYDPDTTTLAQRRTAKAAELRAMPPEEARILGLDHVSERTLRRWARYARDNKVAGLISGNWVRRAGPRPSVTPELREAIVDVRKDTLHRSRMEMTSKYDLVCQYALAKFGPDLCVPSYDTVRRIWIDWYGPGGTRQKYAESADRQRAGKGDYVLVYRPGQVIALDTTGMTVIVRDGMFGEPTPAHLTIALDVYTHSIVAFRLTLVSEVSTDVAMMLHDVMRPLPMRPDWGEDMEWPYAGVPASLVAEFAGHKVAALPFFAPETVTIDHGSTFKNHHLVEVAKIIGTDILPARVLRPIDKAAVERAFGGIQSLLFEYLLGYRGVDVADRGADPEGDSVLTVREMEHLIATWVVKVWQNRELGEFRPAWDPDGRCSPNTLFAAAMNQGGCSLQIPPRDFYYSLLRPHNVRKITSTGVKICGLWYDIAPGENDVLGPYRETPSARGGKHKRMWRVNSDPRDRRYVYFQDPMTHEWHTLKWKGLPLDGEFPAFGDARADELLRAVSAAGLKPRSDAELRPVLLDLIGGAIPVEAWPTQMTKKQRKDHAREVLQAETAAADRPAAPPSAVSRPLREVVPPREQREEPGFLERAGNVRAAVDDERERRRRAAVPGRVSPSTVMTGTGRRRNLLAVPSGEGAGTLDAE
jgi:hypothetical protein